jgi:glycosyltransferase involved in cell wall biosynthesis
MRPVRLATICFSPTVGGLELATLRRAAEMRARGHQAVAVLTRETGLDRHAAALGLPIARVRPRLDYADPIAAWQLRRVLEREESDVLLVARTRDLSTVMLAAGSARAVVLYQQMQFHRPKRGPFHDLVHRRLDACVAITEMQRAMMTQLTSLDPRKIAVVPYGIDAQRFRPGAIAREAARAALDIPPDAFVVGIVGGFDPGKGQRELLEALRLAAESDAALRARLFGLFVGERPTDDRAYVADLHARRDALPFRERVRLRGFLDDPREAYAAMDVFVLASHGETFGMVLQEALAMGVPSVATDAGGVPEIVTHERTGLLVPPRDAAAIAAAIVRLWRDPGLRSRLSNAARSFVLEAYDFDRQYRAFESALVAARDRRCTAVSDTSSSRRRV